MAVSGHIARRTHTAKITERGGGGAGADSRLMDGKMVTMGSLRTIIVGAATSTKSEETSAGLPAVCRTIGEGLKSPKWSQLRFTLSDIKSEYYKADHVGDGRW